MIHFAPCLIGLAFVGLWWRARPRLGRGLLLLLWWCGLIATKLGDVGASLDWPVGRLVEWVGALLLLRAFVGFTAWGRARTRPRQLFGGLLLLYLVLSALAPGTRAAFVLLAIPWLWSFRWREGFGAGLLSVASVTALLAFVLGVVTPTTSPTENPLLSGAHGFAIGVTALAIVYSFLSLFAAAARIHVSIRQIRSRLISSHILAGIVPFCLAVLFLLLCVALYLSTYRGTIGVRALQSASRAAESRIERDLARMSEPGLTPFGEETPGQVLLIRRDGHAIEVVGGTVSFVPESLLNVAGSSRDTPLLWDRRSLFLRARIDTTLSGRRLEIEALAPVDSMRMVRISELLGIPIRVNPTLRVSTAGGGVQIGTGGEDDSGSYAIGPPMRQGNLLPGGAIVSCLSLTEKGWQNRMIAIYSSAGLGEPLVSLFAKARDNPLARVVLALLLMIAIFFLAAISITVTVVYQMGSSITTAVHALTNATAALGKGKLDHRIVIAGKDELWSVAASFNDMAKGLEQMRKVELETERLEEELRLAREIQTRLLPSGPPMLDRLELAGLSLPARQVGGDYFDYLVLERGLVGITVADVSGKGAPAALLMSSFRASLRTQDLAALGPAEVLGRLNRFIYSSVDPGKFITAFLGLIDPETGVIRYANAGHDPPLVVKVDGTVEELTGGGLILGMLPQFVYEEARGHLDLGSVVAVFTDGITEAQNGEGEFFGMERLTEALKANRGRPCADLLREVVGAAQSFAGLAAQSDDITMILARRR